jgi:large subunit ribosomal protein L18
MITRYKSNSQRRKITNRAKVVRHSDRPRLTVFRSNKYIYAQIIDQNTGQVLASASNLKSPSGKTGVESALEVGKEIAEKALAGKVKAVVFDRGPYKYHGRVKALCEGARSANLVI